MNADELTEYLDYVIRTKTEILELCSYKDRDQYLIAKAERDAYKHVLEILMVQQ